MKIIKKCLLVAGLLSFLVAFNVAKSQQTNMKELELKEKLLLKMQAFAEDNDLVMSELVALFGELVFEQKLYSAKGGMGVVAPGIFVDLKYPGNRLVFSDREEDWIGSPSEKEETVIVSGTRVMKLDEFELEPGFLLIAFQQERIRVWDLASYSGGFYPRDGKEKKGAWNNP